VYLTTGTDGC